MIRTNGIARFATSSLLGMASLQALGSTFGPDDAALRSLTQQYVAAWNRADAPGLASLFVPDGDLITPYGIHAQGRAAIQAFYAYAFQQGYGGSRAGIEVVVIRVVRRDVVIIDGTWFIENARTPAGGVAPREQGIATLVAEKTSRGWQVSAVREQVSATAIRNAQE